jgi:hypothetical protein
MKYIITENKLNQVIISYIDNVYGNKKIHMAKGINDGVEIDGTYDFFTDDYYEGFDEDYLFLWTGPEHYENISFADSERKQKLISESPILEITKTGNSKGRLNELFGDMWHEPFKKWFTNKFGLPVKTIYSN